MTETSLFKPWIAVASLPDVDPEQNLLPQLQLARPLAGVPAASMKTHCPARMEVYHHCQTTGLTLPLDCQSF